jgi:hypothetical protein
MKWSPEFVVLDIHIRPVIEQPLNNVRKLRLACCIQWRVFPVAPNIDVRAVPMQ